MVHKDHILSPTNNRQKNPLITFERVLVPWTRRLESNEIWIDVRADGYQNPSTLCRPSRQKVAGNGAADPVQGRLQYYRQARSERRIEWVIFVYPMNNEARSNDHFKFSLIRRSLSFLRGIESWDFRMIASERSVVAPSLEMVPGSEPIQLLMKIFEWCVRSGLHPKHWCFTSMLLI